MSINYKKREREGGGGGEEGDESQRDTRTDSAAEQTAQEDLQQNLTSKTHKHRRRKNLDKSNKGKITLEKSQWRLSNKKKKQPGTYFYVSGQIWPHLIDKNEEEI